MKLIPTLFTVVCMTGTFSAPASVRSADTLAGQAPATPRYIADEVAAIVGGSHILLSDIERTTGEVLKLRQQQGTLSGRPARYEAFETLLLQKMLAEQARADSLDKDLSGGLDDQVEHQIQEMVKEAGSVKALEKKYRKEIYAIKDDLKKDAEDMQLANIMQSNVMQKVSITYKDVARFFETLPTDSLEMVPEQYVYAQIVRFPPETEERKFEVREKLLEYRERILNGESLGALARLYSMDPGTARNGGEWGPGDINQLVYPVVEALEGLQPGKVSEIIETEYGYHIVELISLKGNLVHFRQILLKPKFTLEETEKEMKLLDSLARQIGTDKQAFEEAVKVYSMDKETNQNGGVVFNSRAAKHYFDTKYATPKYMKDNLEPQDYIPLSGLKEGEVSKPYEAIDMATGSTVYKIVRLNKVIPSHHASLQEDYEIIADFALQDKQNRELEKWIKETIRKMYVWIAPEYRDYEFDHNWLKK
ncbi:peptidylprolyl isomerase [Rikenella microfusus]|uniref:Peptidyl-prolyl cis-trans isomerase surA n=2 Tax=Rikenella microfusus TaxID=28139 RepID=A0A379MT50_9BACT|nr:peptidylprolyl isomerase [Rikenella microfusus]SUE34808.1 Peptidyl-prolyl cis-trans isomerase surA [Rikenella microfusus]HJE87702.1 peptidylprolyl isomerase [Rikenella microfusus]